MKISNQITIYKSDPCYESVKQYCRDNLVVSNPDYAKKLRMHYWLGNTPKTLSLYEMVGGNLVLPFGCLKSIWKMANGSNVELDFGESVNIDYGEPLKLYDYQDEAVRACIKGKYGILQSPAGSGKTEVAISLVKSLGKRTLFLTHTADLLNQAKSRAIARGISQDLIGTVTEGMVDIGAGITFATVQTMSRVDLSQYKYYWDVIITDECHRCVGTPASMTMFYKVLNSLAARHKYGLSATVHRSDGMIQATYALLGNVVHIVPDSAVGDKIMKVGICPVYTGTELSRECLNTDGTLNYTSMIGYLSKNVQRNKVILDKIIENRGKSCLILSDRLEHLETLLNSLPDDMWKDATMISGKMTTKKGKAEREQAIEDMRTGNKKYLFATYSLCKEGLDLPILSRLFMASIVSDEAVVIQSIGRIARVYQGKADPICYDFVDQFGMANRKFKQRQKHYKKAGAYIVSEGDV